MSKVCVSNCRSENICIGENLLKGVLEKGVPGGQRYGTGWGLCLCKGSTSQWEAGCVDQWLGCVGGVLVCLEGSEVMPRSILGLRTGQPDCGMTQEGHFALCGRHPEMVAQVCDSCEHGGSHMWAGSPGILWRCGLLA